MRGFAVKEKHRKRRKIWKTTHIYIMLWTDSRTKIEKFYIVLSKISSEEVVKLKENPDILTQKKADWRST